MNYEKVLSVTFVKLAQHGTDQLWHLIWGIQWIFSLFIDTSCPNSSLASERSNEGASATAERGAFLAGAGASQWSHHGVWNQVLRESKCEGREMYRAVRLRPPFCAAHWGGPYARCWGTSGFIVIAIVPESPVRYYNFCVLTFCYTNENIPLAVYLFIQFLKSQ